MLFTVYIYQKLRGMGVILSYENPNQDLSLKVDVEVCRWNCDRGQAADRCSTIHDNSQNARYHSIASTNTDAFCTSVKLTFQK